MASVASAPPAASAAAAARLDIFGPSNPLYSSVANHLPDVLTRIVVQYASPLYPRQARYAGNAIMESRSDIVYETRHQLQSAPSSPSPSSSSCLSNAPRPRFSLYHRSFSVSGWLKRRAADRPRCEFLLSVQLLGASSAACCWLHLGYLPHPHSHGQANCFTLGFYGNDLDARPPLIDLQPNGQWEHWAATFHFPLPAEPETAQPLGRRRLYRDGRLLLQDDCLPLLIGEEHQILLGTYRRGMWVLQGGICDVRLYSRALQQQEVEALYAGEDAAVSRDGLELQYELTAADEPSADGSSLLRDSSGHERHALVKGAGLSFSSTGSAGEDLPAAHETLGDWDFFA